MVQLVRKSDGVVLASQVRGEDRSGWFEFVPGEVEYLTAGGVIRDQSKGVKYEMYTMTAIYGQGDPTGANMTAYAALKNSAKRPKALCAFTDPAGVVTDVRIRSSPQGEGVARWQEVVTRDILFVTFTVFDPVYRSL